MISFFHFVRGGDFKQNDHGRIMMKTVLTQVDIFNTSSLYTNSTNWSRPHILVMERASVNRKHARIRVELPLRKSDVLSCCTHLLKPFTTWGDCSRPRASTDGQDRHSCPSPAVTEVYPGQEAVRRGTNELSGALEQRSPVLKVRECCCCC